MQPKPADRILIVDDNAQNIVLIRAQLERAGYVVTSATSGREGLNAARLAPPDLILLDIMMPGLDGYTVCQELKTTEATRTIPVVMLTSLREREDKIRALEVGADDFISKPADRAELLARVRSLIRIKHYVGALSESRDEIGRQGEQLAIEKSRAEAILYSTRDGIVTTDQEGRVTLLNPAAEALTGVSFEAARGQLWRHAFGLRQVDDLPLSEETDPVAKVLRTGSSIEEDIAVRRPDGRRLVISLSAAPVSRPSSQVTGVVTVLRDVTRQRELDDMKREFVTLVSHELRTPLASIFGFSELLLSRELLTDKARTWVTTMHRESQRLSELVGNFLDVENLDSKRITYHFRSLRITDVLARIEETLAPQLVRHRLVSDISLDNVTVRADRDRLEQVLMNLLSNAIKYSPAGGNIHVRARVSGAAATIVVSDPGLGLPSEAIPRLFTKFNRVDRAEHRAISGTGLGLAICKQIVAGWGGSVHAESRGLGQGSTFSFTVPLSTEAMLSPTEVRSQPARGRVLVVKDDQSLAALIREQVTQAGYAVEVVSTGEAAIARAIAERPAAVVLDVRLAGKLDGWDVIEALRASTATIDIPIIAISGREHQERARVLGVDDYLVKPSPADRLIESIRRLAGPPSRFPVLIVDRDEDERRAMSNSLRQANFPVVESTGDDEAMSRLREISPMVIILGMSKSHVGDWRVLEAARADPRLEAIPVLVVNEPERMLRHRGEMLLRVEALFDKKSSSPIDLTSALLRTIGHPG